MRKRKWKQIMAIALTIVILSGCAVQKTADGNAESVPIEEDMSAAAGTGQNEGENVAVSIDTEVPVAGLFTGNRPILGKAESESSEVSQVTPCVASYTVAPDLSNIDNQWQFHPEGEMADKLVQNGFVVCGNAGSEFFEIYEENRYNMFPSFVTVDSLMHTYHLYFSYLLKNIERDYLSERIAQLSRKMLDNSMAQYEQLKGSEWESAAGRNVAFFTIGTKLLDDSTEVNDYVKDIVGVELERISQADGIYESGITGGMEDYSQYIPRGYYEGDEGLERYFRSMMWYGRVHFSQNEEDMDRSALLITLALAGDGEAYALWESIYAVTSFFAGASDDNGVCEYASAIYKAYGDDVRVSGLVGEEDAFSQFHKLTAALAAPQINSIPIKDGEDNVIPGFRFMGQRFTIDGVIMQNLIYSNVGSNSVGKDRMLPDVLDVPAALGSDAALQILEEEGNMDFEGYLENMDRLKAALQQENNTLWSASLYAGWLNTLRPLLTEKGEGYPMFMQSGEWMKKNLECFAGSFTELKHDTILYSKQVIAEMGGGYEEEPDYRGYVEPEPLVYGRFADLASRTAQGLEEYGMLDADSKEDLLRLCQIADQLLTISNKELLDETLTDDEYAFIEGYGGNIEHFWYEAARDGKEEEYIAARECPAAVVADIATDPNGTVLEAATGNPSMIYVVVKVDGKIKLAKGSVYSFYQFEWPLDDRLTDSKWRQMMGIQADENGYYNYDHPVQKPDWTASYRYRYEWE